MPEPTRRQLGRLEKPIKERYGTGTMTALEKVIEDLKTLPPNRLEKAALYVHALTESEKKRRSELLEATAGCLPRELGESFEKAIEDCERVDERDW